MDIRTSAQVPTYVPKVGLVNLHEQIDRLFADLKCWRVWQEVVADEKAYEHKVIEDSLVVLGNVWIVQLKIKLKVLPQLWDGEKLEWFGADRWLALLRVVLFTLALPLVLGFPKDALHLFLLRLRILLIWLHLLAKYGAVSFVRSEAEHDEVSIEAIHHMAHVGVVAIEATL